MFFNDSRKRRSKEPPVYDKRRGSKEAALRIASDPILRQRALDSHRHDQRSEGDASHFNFATWSQIHAAWWAFDRLEATPVLPLTATKIECVGAP